MLKDAVKLTSRLIQFETITPKDCGILDFISGLLKELGFEIDVQFFGEGEKKTGNIYARYGKSGRNFCFVGHVDVVHPGDERKWTFEPFSGLIIDDAVCGRGAVDMKGGIACFLVSLGRFLKENKDFSESISILLSCDEEDSGEFGIKEMLPYLERKGEKIDTCIIGEPTCNEKICDTIKIGRRGSINFILEITGKQGHVAYVDKFKNPITILAEVINILKNHRFDEGNEFYEPTNLEFVDISTTNIVKSTNVVPDSAKAMFNIRFNNLQKGEDLANLIRERVNFICKDFKCKLEYKISNESFFYGRTEICNITEKSVKKITGKSPELSCSGGTTDGRYVIKYCKNVVEIGLNNSTAHKIDEFTKTEDLKKLSEIYFEILKSYFK